MSFADPEPAAGRPLRVGLLGQGFMGEVHARSLLALPVIDPEAPALRLAALAGRDPARLELSRERFGFDRATTDWHDLVEDPEIDVLDNVGPNALHVDPTLAALAAGKHVLCEKPLAPTAEQAWRMWEAAVAADVTHGCSFNWRFLPAIQVLRQAVVAGDLGEVLSMQCDFVVPRREADRGAWRAVDPAQRGGVIGDLIAHHVDLARHLLGEIAAVDAAVGGQGAGPGSGLEDRAVALARTESGVPLSFHASRASNWPTVTGTIEVRGADRSLRFSLEALNELEERDAGSVRKRYVYESDSAFGQHWYPRGHPLGWDASFVHQFADFFRAIEGDGGGIGATFADGCRAAEVTDAIHRSAESGTGVPIERRPAPDASERSTH